MNTFKKITAITLILLILIGKVGSPVSVYAEETTETTDQTTQTQEAPTAPSAPTAPEAPKAPEAPTAPSAPTAPTAPSAPTAPEAPKAPEKPVYNYEKPSYPTYYNQPQTTSTQPAPSTGTSSNGNVGDTTVATGDATNDSGIINTGNNNYAASGAGCCDGGSASVTNSGNGAHSNNQGSATTTTNNNTDQNNSANLSNNLNQNSVTGTNDTSWNVGNSSIETGDANVTGTIVNSVNTNVDGVAVAEFNIADDHVGDIVLDFGANCIAGCGGQSIAVENSDNGSFSYNDAEATTTTNNTTNQNNDANVSNGMTLVADSGHNDASFNTGGDSNIVTGDANVSANAITLANNNFAGNVIYGVVNIFGDLVGDIILTQEMLDAICGGTCGGSTSVANSDNGAWSDNTASSTSSTNNNTFQNNDADITNTLVLDAETGNNDANFNTNGNSSITTGEANIDANILNIANMNLTGGNYWLVLVNEAGNWIGHIMGGDGTNMAGSSLFSFIVNPATGSVTATNSDNGAGSDNNSTVNSETNNTVNQTNTAVINNNLNLTANTGNNDASYNTGGSSNITTGDANIVANIVNFVNNNIVGDGTLVVTVINVFGSWLGDFIGPGQSKATAQSTNNGTGGNENVTQNNSSVQGASAENKNSQVAAAIVAAQGTIQTVGNTIASLELSFAGFDNPNDEENKEALVAGSNSNKGIIAADTNDKIKVNLAWMFLTFPLLGLIWLERKFALMHTIVVKGVRLLL